MRHAPRAPHWRFAIMTPAEINQDPVQGEFFTREDDLSGRLVREAIQNSLDAGRPGETVRVQFTFSGQENALEPHRMGAYLKDLEEHVDAVVGAGGMNTASGEDEEEAELNALECFERPMEYLVIEDFGTTGLTGDVHANSEQEKENDFWGFFRSSGISPKGDNAAGSWGLGKWVFPDASIINAYLGLTKRAGEENALLMGMALLKTHHLVTGSESRKYRHYGSFAAFSDDEDDKWFPVPVDELTEAPFIQRTLEDFKVERQTPGLSVIVPYPKPDLRPRSIARAVLTNYFFPIVRGDLEVHIIHPREGRRRIDSQTIDEEVLQIKEFSRDAESAESMRAVVDLARWAIKDQDHVRVRTRYGRPALSEHKELGVLRKRFDRGERLAFTISTRVKLKNGDPEATAFNIYVERDNDLKEGHDYFVRGNLQIPKMDHIKRQQARSLLLVEHGSRLARMLRDAEGPAHESWDMHAQRLKENWTAGPARVQETRRAASHILQLLTARPHGLQKDALADLFPGHPTEDGSRPSRTGSQGTSGNRDAPPYDHVGSPLTVRSPAGAFSIRKASTTEEAVAGRMWTVRFAYDTVRGNPFKLFEAGAKSGQPDFSALADGDLHVTGDGCDYSIVDRNEIRFEPTEEEFTLTVSGFDARDLRVRPPVEESGLSESKEEVE